MSKNIFRSSIFFEQLLNKNSIIVPLKIRNSIDAVIKLFLTLGLMFSCYLMTAIIFPYSSGKLDIDFLLTKQHIIHLSYYRWSFYFHIFSSLFILMAGLSQFSKTILLKQKNLHRVIGKGYVFLILFISAPSALYMSFYGNGGWPSRISFILLSCLWWWTTFVAFNKIRQGDVQSHKAFMIRSYALTLSAVSLRMYQMIIGYFNLMNPVDAYVMLAWISWIGNILIAELVIYQQKLKTRPVVRKFS